MYLKLGYGKMRKKYRNIEQRICEVMIDACLSKKSDISVKYRGSLKGVEIMFQYIITEDGFTLDFDFRETDVDKADLLDNAKKWETLYNASFLEPPRELKSAGVYLYRVAKSFVQCLTREPDLEVLREEIKVVPDEVILEQLLSSVPFTLGSEFVTEGWICHAFEEFGKVFSGEIKKYDGSVALYLSGKSQRLRVPERLFFHLVETDKEDAPFAFLATYSTKDAKGKIKHMPLHYALTEYQAKREQLLELLACLNRASEVSELIKEFVESGELFHPLRLNAQEAYKFLSDVRVIEECGIVCRIPNWWRRNKNQVGLSVKIGEEKPPMVGMDAILSMVPQLCVDGVALTESEIEQLLAQTNGLAFLKGKWVEVDHERLHRYLEQMQQYEGEVTLLEALRMGIREKENKKDEVDIGPILTNGAWLSQLMLELRKPKKLRSAVVPKSFQATLRPYQKAGYTWLNYMNDLHFGACLADDMGLGKTVQVLAFLEKLRKNQKGARVLLVVPASLIGNWQKEAEKFAPLMTVLVLHGGGSKTLGELVKEDESFLTITTYGMVARIESLQEIVWDCLVLDEAQAIKNPATKQTKQIKKLKSKQKIAMTGTPIENDLSNLWSLFDFLNKGLLGSSAEFHDFCKELEAHPEGYAKLKSMIMPFMLRRVKTDKEIISDLPEKLEQIEYVGLSKKQTVIYRKFVADFAKKLEEADGMERRGMVLASLAKLKQICNHPDQYLGQESYEASESGKFEMLKSLCETIREKRERVLIFTQFKEITEYLDAFLEEIFQRKGFVLHGGTPIAERTKMVEQFQSERYIPYMVLSVRAGGTGLTLTNANHVIHFDRWWNPAVENQATDRAYRIGQTKKVIVHKLVCKGTIEEKIDKMLESKKELAENVIGSGGESWITEMSNEELLSMLSLD